MDMPKLIFADIGSVTDPHASSGTLIHIYSALNQHADCVGALNVDFPQYLKILNAVCTFKSDPKAWQQHRHKSMFTFWLRSQLAKLRMRSLPKDFDIYFQHRSLFEPPVKNKPYALTFDVTHADTLESWKGWSPFSQKEQRCWLDKERKLYDNAQCLLPRSHYVANTLMNYYQQPEERIFVVGSGINLGQTPAQHSSYNSKTLLFAGYEFERKGGYVLLQAFEDVKHTCPDARLIIVGPETIDAKLPDGVTLLGRVRDRNKMSELFSLASIFVMPSFFEPWGNVYLEAMAHGTPCVGCRWGATPEIIDDGVDGCLVERGSAEDLSRVLISMLKDPVKLQNMGSIARTRITSKFAWDICAGKMVDALKAGLKLTPRKDAGGQGV